MTFVNRVTIGMGLAAFGLYLHTAGPALVPYRDAGEMTTSAATLGILHPTSYPLYSLLGHLATRLPLGNVGYRLNVFSALAMAAAWALACLLFAAMTQSASAAVATVLLGALSYQFWAHALVAEMYTLNLFFLSALLLTVYRRQWLLAAFLAGAGLANRADLLLTLPAAVVLGWGRWRADPTTQRPSVFLLLLAFVGGLSLYAYLPIRAHQRPWLNWNDPSTLDSLIGTLTRRGYGGTLDLLSTSYKLGENFLSEVRLYAIHLWRDFSYIGAPLAAFGTFAAWRKDRWTAGALLAGFFTTGPLFIFLGNLPPNPHAVAIMEAGYLMPDFFLLGCVAFGLAGLKRGGQSRWSFRALSLAFIFVLAWQGWTTLKDVNKRQNFLAVDFARNVYRSLPPQAIVVARSDVPIFSLFYGRWVHPNGADRWPLAQALMASPWYERMLKEAGSGLTLAPLKNAADWSQLARWNAGRLVAATTDIDRPADAPSLFRPKGLISYVSESASPKDWQKISPDALFDSYAYRGPYKTNAYRDFFSQELIEQYARAWVLVAEPFLRNSRWDEAKTAYQNAFRHKADLPYAAFELAYAHFAQGHYARADFWYRLADKQFERLGQQAKEWKSLPPIPNQIREHHAQMLAQRGVTQERLGNPAQAENLYQRALQLDPQSADGHYNLAVLLWKRGEWPQVVAHLEAIARAHPEDARWKQYLPAAVEHLRRSR